MSIEDIKIARNEAKKFLEFTDDFLKAMDGHEWGNPAEGGLVKAQSLILSRALAAMRNPDSCPRSDFGKKYRRKK